MRYFLFACFAAAAMVPAASHSQSAEWAFLGHGWLGTNDQYGDRQDRWRSATLQLSFLAGREHDRADPPARIGELLEFRLGAAVFTPESLEAPEADDRPYAATLSFGVHSHWRQGQTDFRVGADLVFIGPQTGVDDLQATAHDRLNQPSPANAQSTQLPSNTHLAVSGEVARSFKLTEGAILRPFAAVRAGDETYARVGADLIIGGFGSRSLLVRDTYSGLLYEAGRARDGGANGLSFIVGGDVAAVGNSVFLPDDRNATLSDTRSRARAGMHWRGDWGGVFAGVTWLGPEFEQQDEGQALGALSVRFTF